MPGRGDAKGGGGRGKTTGRPVCVGNGEKAKGVTAEGIKEFPCPSPDGCEVGKRGGCKPYGRLNVQVDGQDDELGSFIFRTTGFNSIRTLTARLEYFESVSGGNTRYLALMLKLRGKSTTQSHRAPVFYVDLCLPEGVSLKEAVHQARTETAQQEESHAKIFFKFLEGNMVEITATYPAGKLGTTAENLKAAAAGENEEWTALYPNFGEIAAQEGFPKIAAAFKLISKIEAEHEKRFLKLLSNIENNKVFEDDEEVEWVCRKCGHVHKGKKALENCPTCNHQKAYFERKANNY